MMIIITSVNVIIILNITIVVTVSSSNSSSNSITTISIVVVLLLLPLLLPLLLLRAVVVVVRNQMKHFQNIIHHCGKKKYNSGILSLFIDEALVIGLLNFTSLSLSIFLKILLKTGADSRKKDAPKAIHFLRANK